VIDECLPDGWLHTSDRATMDAEGYVYLVGRPGDRIKRGGENVHPVEVEDVLREHPAVREVAVTGVPDAELGQSVRAFVVLNGDVPEPDPEELRVSRAVSSRASRCRRRGGSCRNCRGTPVERCCAGSSPSGADRYRTGGP
jgi:acyl-CoA synthetase (AMP-forming)/AMP-acid ligase II